MIGHKYKNLIANIFQIRYHLTNVPVISQHKTGVDPGFLDPKRVRQRKIYIFQKKPMILNKFLSWGYVPLGSTIARHLLEDQEMKIFQIKLSIEFLVRSFSEHRWIHFSKYTVT